MLPGAPNGTYDPKKVIFTYNGLIFTGFAEDSMIKASRNVATFDSVVGASGEESWTASADQSGKVEIEIMSTSQDNDVLTAQFLADQATKAGLAPLQITELNGTSLVHAAFARITKPADWERKKAQGASVWMFASTNLEIQNAGISA